MKPMVSPLFLGLLASSAFAQSRTVTDEKAGLSVVLPGPDWKKTDHGAAGVVAHVYSPASPPIPRVTLMRFPKIFLPKGMETRAAQIEASPLVKRGSMKEVRLAGQSAMRYEYSTEKTRTLEYGIEDGDAFLIFQISATRSDWKDPARSAELDGIRKSLKILAGDRARARLQVDTKTPEQVRRARRPLEKREPDFSILEHDVALGLYPAEGRIVVTDSFRVRSLADGVTKLGLFTNHVDIDGFSAGTKALEWTKKQSLVRVKLDEPLNKGGEIRLRFRAHANDLNVSEDQKLVAEVSVVAQVNETSCFSSHVIYYPVDRRNDASVRMSISVPNGWTAVSGGEPAGVEAGKERTTFRYVSRVRCPRALPFGFAAARYEQITEKTAGGLVLTFYFPKGKEKEARQRMRVALESGAMLERLQGPLPWKRVSFCWVKPWKKETGVSLPGLVLLSEGFYRDAEDVKLDGEALNDPVALGLLIVADELSHQWNFYSISLPNELAEGISTFTNLLYLEGLAGPGEYRKGVGFCAGAYLAGAESSRDVALADPMLYLSDVYRVVAFCKVPAALDLLRTRLGERRFAAAWRDAFTSLHAKQGSYAAFERALSESSGEDLRPFFDQWFFQAGHPRLQVGWRNTEQGSEKLLELSIEQSQPGGLFDTRLALQADCEGKGMVSLPLLRVHERKQVVSRKVPGSVRSVKIEPDCSLVKLSVEGEEK